MEKKEATQYALRGNVSQKAITNLRRHQAFMGSNGVKVTIEQALSNILETLKNPFK